MSATARGWLLLAGAILTEVTASLSLKGALDHPALYAVVVAGYGAAFVLLALVLRTGMALGVAYGIWGATGVALTAVGSLLVFREPITLLMGIGIAVVIAGVLCVELGAQAAHAVGTAPTTPSGDVADGTGQDA
ncbi:DMT family transporter [Curtobacterium sp. Leaf261]|uniref:DMT family transporter n=1 Tax=Curtobacterium sp. Leaf261 TaxID=1736311 RepID=UPI0006F693AB|nr:SMR family transporter [Curtobacterium sp. Leaf261]KQO60033.1 cation transporter [Curtobacterium sp. Leaf261]